MHSRMNRKKKSKRQALLGALFIAAEEHGIDQQELRDTIAPQLIKKRLSAASEQEIKVVLKHIAGPRRHEGTKKYESSLQGLRQEVQDLARERFGESWEQPLNMFCRRFGVQHYRWLDVSHAKAVKEALIRLQKQKAKGDAWSG